MRVFLAVLLVNLIVSAPAVAAAVCDLKKVPFGSSIEQVVSIYTLDVLDTSTEGEFSISEMGKIVCNDLPENSMIEFTFIDDVFVKIKIENPNTSEELLQYAKEVFGENDDKDRKKASSGLTPIALWAKDKEQTVVYSTHNKVREGNFEGLNITSKMHNDLFAKIAEQKGKAIDEYLKEQGLGKYSKAYQQQQSVGSSGGSSTSTDLDSYSGSSDSETTTEDYDADALKKMKEEFEKSQDAWKKKNDANKLGR